MDLYSGIVDYFGNLPHIVDWEDAQTLFRRAATGQPRHWRLPAITCEAVGGAPDQAIPAVTAIACLHIGIILVDDLLDDDPRGEYRRIGAPATANLASAFQAASMSAITHSQATPTAKLIAMTSLSQMALATAIGQYWDSQNPCDEAAYWRLIQTKSAPFFGAALHVGALLGGATSEVANPLRALGNLYGEMIQIHDDLGDTMAVPANSDWTQGRSPLPVLFAQVVDHPDRERFLKLRKDVLDPHHLDEAQAILVRCGAVSYCVDQILRRYDEALKMLVAIPLHLPVGLENMLDALIHPIQELFETIGMDQSVLPPYV